MTWVAVLSYFFRAIGLVRLADGMWKVHVEKVRQQTIADTPVTNKEWEEDAKNGRL